MSFAKAIFCGIVKEISCDGIIETFWMEVKNESYSISSLQLIAIPCHVLGCGPNMAFVCRGNPFSHVLLESVCGAIA